MTNDTLDYRSRALLEAIRTLSRFTACKARTKVLSTATGMAVRTVEKYLAKLEDLGAIQRYTSTTRMRKGGLISQQRTIYLISSDPYDLGARRLASLAASFGKTTNRKVDVFCGRLGCTPKQLRTWFKWAQLYGWLDGNIENGKCSFTRVGNFDPLVVPDPARPVPLGPPRPPTRSGEQLAAELFRALDGPVSAATNEQLAAKLKKSVRSVKRAISKLKQSGRIRVEPRGRTRLLIQGVTEPSEDLLDIVLPVGPREKLLEALRRGPLSLADARAAAGCSASWFRAIVRRAKDAGQIFTGTFRGQPGVAREPLTEEDARPLPPRSRSPDPLARGAALYMMNNALIEVSMARSGIRGSPTARARQLPDRVPDEVKLTAYAEAVSSGSGDPSMDAARMLLDKAFKLKVPTNTGDEQGRSQDSPPCP